MALGHEKLSYAVIGKAMEVHRELGPGVDEIFYHRIMSERLQQAGIEHLSKPRRELVHRGVAVDVFEPDLVFPDQLIAELKWLWKAFPPESFVQLTCYLKFWRIRDGLLLDFGKESLVQKRFVFEQQRGTPFDSGTLLVAPPKTDLLPAKLLCVSISKIVNEYGLGYRDTTYRGLLAAELTAEGVPCKLLPTAAILCGLRLLGDTQFPCIVVPGICAIMTVAWRDAIRAADCAILQSWLKHLKLPWGAVVNFGRNQTQAKWVLARQGA
jgi:GxxExxY protein